MRDELDIDTVRHMLKAWGACVNGGLPGGYGQPGLYQEVLRDESWCPQADEIEAALRIVRDTTDGLRKAEAIRLHYASNLLMHEQAKKLKMTESDYEIYLNSVERLVAYVLTVESA